MTDECAGLYPSGSPPIRIMETRLISTTREEPVPADVIAKVGVVALADEVVLVS